VTENLHDDSGSSSPSNVAPKAQLKEANIAAFFTYSELPGAMRTYDFEARIADAKRRGMWVCSYIEAHIWDPEIECKLVVLNR
jgi:hypothetical protein